MATNLRAKDWITDLPVEGNIYVNGFIYQWARLNGNWYARYHDFKQVENSWGLSESGGPGFVPKTSEILPLSEETMLQIIESQLHA